MTPDAAGIEAALAAGLAAHQLQYGPAVGQFCSCGATGKPDPGALMSMQQFHAAHQAAALLPVVTQAQAEALRAAADAMGRAARDGGSHWRAHAWANWLRERANRLGGDA